MSKVIIFTNEFGNVTVTYPTPEFLQTYTIENLLGKDCPNHGIIVNESVLPYQYDDLFDAWELNGETVTVNLSKAKEVTKKRLRLQRESLLSVQDILFQRALETGADTTAIVAEKQRLRDITLLVDEATTPEELKSIHC
jgi:hypothetical protein